MNTPIEDLIERLKARAEQSGTPSVKNAFIIAIQEAASSKPAERKAIEEAYFDGLWCVNVVHADESRQFAAGYFTTKYGNNG